MGGVEVMRIEKSGGTSPFGSSVFPGTTYSDANLKVTLKLEEWSWQWSDKALTIPIPQDTASNANQTIEGGFKWQTFMIKCSGYIDETPTSEGNVQTKLQKLAALQEYGDPNTIYVHFRGSYLFGLVPGAAVGQCKITDLRIDETAQISEPALNISVSSPTSVSTPKRARVQLTITKVSRQV